MKAGYLKVGVTKSGRDIRVSFLEEVDVQLGSILGEYSDDELFDVFAVFE